MRAIYARIKHFYKGCWCSVLLEVKSAVEGPKTSRHNNEGFFADGHHPARIF